MQVTAVTLSLEEFALALREHVKRETGMEPLVINVESHKLARVTVHYEPNPRVTASEFHHAFKV